VDRVVEPKDYAALGLPLPEKNDGVGDLVLFAKAGHAFQATLVGAEVLTDSGTYLGTHGYPNSDPELDGLFIAWGSGIQGGAKLDRMANLDVAPTIARLLGLKLGTVDGRELGEILKP
jgi:predicted AlkP superfamily pyrophosphatase or phosphodiesterase